MNTQQYNRLKTCAWVIGLSLSLCIVQIFARYLIITSWGLIELGWGLTDSGFVNTTFNYSLLHRICYFSAKGWEIAAYIKSIEVLNLLTELLVAIGIITGIRYYLAHAQKDYRGMMSGRKWDDTTALYIGFAILSFVGMLSLCKAHLLYSSLDKELNEKELALFPREQLYWSKIQWIMVVPIYTEILYRGLIFRQCKQNGLRDLSTILLSAFGFALMYIPFTLIYGSIALQYRLIMVPHIWQWYTYKFVLGYILAMVYARTQRIDLVVMLQSLHNFLMCLFDLSGIRSDVMFWQVTSLLLMLGVQYIICCEVPFTRDILFGPSAKAHARTTSED